MFCSDFLASQGDFDINISEWAPYTSEGGLVVEDVSKTSFSFMRKGDFLHPRTSMLMFGPKNALNTQSHYLYIVNNKGETKPPEGDGDWLASTIPVKFMVVTVSTFDSIPMADVFKLAQYWSFEAKQLPDGSPDPINTIIRGGLNVYFVKYTLIKGQISQGCTEELVDMSKAWVTHAKKRLTASKSTSIPTIADGGAVVGVSESPMAGYTASVQPYFNEHYSQVIIGCLILLILLLICLLIQQYRSHYFIIRHVDSLLDAYQKSSAECVAK